MLQDKIRALSYKYEQMHKLINYFSNQQIGLLQFGFKDVVKGAINAINNVGNVAKNTTNNVAKEVGKGATNAAKELVNAEKKTENEVKKIPDQIKAVAGKYGPAVPSVAKGAISTTNLAKDIALITADAMEVNVPGFIIHGITAY